jgi:hypothetical protein
MYKRKIIQIVKVTAVKADGKQSHKLAICFRPSFLLSLFFFPEDGGGMFLRNVG